MLQEYLYHDPTMSKGKILFLSYTNQKENKNIFHIIFLKHFVVYIFVLFIICFDQKHIVNKQENSKWYGIQVVHFFATNLLRSWKWSCYVICVLLGERRQEKMHLCKMFYLSSSLFFSQLLEYEQKHFNSLFDSSSRTAFSHIRFYKPHMLIRKQPLGSVWANRI